MSNYKIDDLEEAHVYENGKREEIEAKFDEKKRFLKILMTKCDSFFREESVPFETKRNIKEELAVILCFVIHSVGYIWFFPIVCRTFNFWVVMIYLIVNLGVFAIGVVLITDVVVDWIFRPARKAFVTYVPDEELFQKAMRVCAKEARLSFIPSKRDLLRLYRMEQEKNEILEYFLMNRKLRRLQHSLAKGCHTTRQLPILFSPKKLKDI